MNNKVPFVCPRCENIYHAALPQIVDITSHKAKMKILNEEYFNCDCSVCGFKYNPFFLTTFLDKKRQVAIVTSSKYQHLLKYDESFSEIGLDYTRANCQGHIISIENDNDFRTAIICLDNDLDYRIVKLTFLIAASVFADKKLLESREELNIKDAYFSGKLIKDEFLEIVFETDDGLYYCPFSFKAYKEVYEKEIDRMNTINPIMFDFKMATHYICTKDISLEEIEEITFYVVLTNEDNKMLIVEAPPFLEIDKGDEVCVNKQDRCLEASVLKKIKLNKLSLCLSKNECGVITSKYKKPIFEILDEVTPKEKMDEIIDLSMKAIKSDKNKEILRVCFKLMDLSLFIVIEGDSIDEFSPSNHVRKIKIGDNLALATYTSKQEIKESENAVCFPVSFDDIVRLVYRIPKLNIAIVDEDKEKIFNSTIFNTYMFISTIFNDTNLVPFIDNLTDLEKSYIGETNIEILKQLVGLPPVPRFQKSMEMHEDAELVKHVICSKF